MRAHARRAILGPGDDGLAAAALDDADAAADGDGGGGEDDDGGESVHEKRFWFGSEGFMLDCMRLSVLLVALCQGLLIVCFYRPMLVAVSRWEGLDGIAPPALLVLLVAAVVPLFIVLILTEAATQIYTVVTSVESMIDARTIARVNRRQDTARAFKALAIICQVMLEKERVKVSKRALAGSASAASVLAAEDGDDAAPRGRRRCSRVSQSASAVVAAARFRERQRSASGSIDAAAGDGAPGTAAAGEDGEIAAAREAMREEAAEDSSIRLSVRRQSTFTIMAGLSHIDYAFAHALFQRIRRDSDRIRMMQTLQVMQALGVSANEAGDDSALAPAVATGEGLRRCTRSSCSRSCGRSRSTRACYASASRTCTTTCARRPRRSARARAAWAPTSRSTCTSLCTTSPRTRAVPTPTRRSSRRSSRAYRAARPQRAAPRL